MIFNLPKKEDRKLLYELYYLGGIEFAKLMGPKDRPEKRQNHRYEGAKNDLPPLQMGIRRTCMRGK